jgi:hypothetical protein
MFTDGVLRTDCSDWRALHLPRIGFLFIENNRTKHLPELSLAPGSVNQRGFSQIGTDCIHRFARIFSDLV